MSRRLVFTPDAQADLDEIFLFIAADNPDRARAYIEQIVQNCRKLTTTPMIGVERSVIWSGLRILPLWRRIIVAYELPPDRVDILRIFSAGQDYETIMRGG